VQLFFQRLIVSQLIRKIVPLVEERRIRNRQFFLFLRVLAVVLHYVDEINFGQDHLEPHNALCDRRQVRNLDFLEGGDAFLTLFVELLIFGILDSFLGLGDLDLNLSLQFLLFVNLRQQFFLKNLLNGLFSRSIRLDHTAEAFLHFFDLFNEFNY